MSRYIVQQRGGDGVFRVRGSYVGGRPKYVEANFASEGYKVLTSLTTENGRFEGVIPGASLGSGSLLLRLNSSGVTEADIGVGDVFVIAGQSNAMGTAENLQTHSHASLRAGVFTKAGMWVEAADGIDYVANPRFSVQSNGSYGLTHGTTWTKMLTAALSALGVPVGLVPCARDGTAISSWARNESDHDDPTTLYGAMIRQARDAGGVKAVLWWQGESDAIAGRTKAQYKADLQALGDAIYEDLGVPLIACKFLNCSGLDAGAQAAIHDAIGEAWGTHHILAGPDLSDLASDDGYHAITDGKIATCASRWWAAIEAALYA